MNPYDIAIDLAELEEILGFWASVTERSIDWYVDPEEADRDVSQEEVTEHLETSLEFYGHSKKILSLLTELREYNKDRFAGEFEEVSYEWEHIPISGLLEEMKYFEDVGLKAERYGFERPEVTRQRDSEFIQEHLGEEDVDMYDGLPWE